jgi:hypothetical protein
VLKIHLKGLYMTPLAIVIESEDLSGSIAWTLNPLPAGTELFIKEDLVQAESVAWLKVIDEAMAVHEVGVANLADDYETAKGKLNTLLCIVQDARSGPADFFLTEDDLRAMRRRVRASPEAQHKAWWMLLCQEAILADRAALEQAEPVECPIGMLPIYAKYCSAQTCNTCKPRQQSEPGQPHYALRIADALDGTAITDMTETLTDDAAAELRRQHAEIRRQHAKITRLEAKPVQVGAVTEATLKDAFFKGFHSVKLYYGDVDNSAEEAWKKFMLETEPMVEHRIHPTNIYDFAGWLTTRPGLLEVGSSYDASPMVDAIREYLHKFPDRFITEPIAIPGAIPMSEVSTKSHAMPERVDALKRANERLKQANLDSTKSWVGLSAKDFETFEKNYGFVGLSIARTVEALLKGKNT